MKNKYNPAEDSEYMSAAMTDHFTKLIHDQLEFAENFVADQTKIALQSDNEADPYDKADLENRRRMAYTNRDRYLNVISECNKSLALIKNEEYGYCKCGEEIGVKRLEFNPSIKLCYDCADLEA